MSETLTHTGLVELLVAWLQAEYTAMPGVCLFCDCPVVLSTEKPAAIEGFYPDACLITTPPKVTVLGEAKTLPDLESARSLQQLTAFFRFLHVRPKPLLVM